MSSSRRVAKFIAMRPSGLEEQQFTLIAYAHFPPGDIRYIIHCVIIGMDYHTPVTCSPTHYLVRARSCRDAAVMCVSTASGTA
jgi:hypothetical protein